MTDAIYGITTPKLSQMMNKHATSNFVIPFSKMDLNDQTLQSGQKSPAILDSPDRSEPNDESKEDLSNVLTKLRGILQLRYNIATIKESLLFSETSNRLPPFISASIECKPYYGSMAIKAKFDEVISTSLDAMKKELTTKLKETCDNQMQAQTTKFYEEKNSFLSTLDITDPTTGTVRTKLHTEAEKLLNEFKAKRAQFAKDLKAPTQQPAWKQSREARKPAPYNRDNSKRRAKESNFELNAKQMKILKGLFFK